MELMTHEGCHHIGDGALVRHQIKVITLEVCILYPKTYTCKRSNLARLSRVNRAAVAGKQETFEARFKDIFWRI